MKFSESLSEFTTRWRRLASFNAQKVREASRYVICHTCWFSFIVGIFLLVIGIVQKVHIIRNSNTPLLEGTGLFFIIIGGILFISSPLFALYEYHALETGHRRRVNEPGRGGTETGTPTNEYPNDLPTYDEITKHDNNRFSIASRGYPESLAVDTLGSDPFGLPDYNDIVRTQSKRRMETTTATITDFPEVESPDDYVATISPSVQIIEAGTRKVSNSCRVHVDDANNLGNGLTHDGKSWVYSRQ